MQQQLPLVCLPMLAIVVAPSNSFWACRLLSASHSPAPAPLFRMASESSRVSQLSLHCTEKLANCEENTRTPHIAHRACLPLPL